MVAKFLIAFVGMILTLMAYRMMAQRAGQTRVKVRHNEAKRGNRQSNETSDLVQDPVTGVYRARD